jgi:hypothetical protein
VLREGNREARKWYEEYPSRVECAIGAKRSYVSYHGGHEEVVQVVPSHAKDGKRSSTLSGTAGSIEHRNIELFN